MLQESKQVVELKKKYKNSLADKADVLDQLIAKLTGVSIDTEFADVEGSAGLEVVPSDNNDVLEEIHDYLHKLAGSSGMYGFDDVAKRCRKTMAHLSNDSVESVVERLGKVKKRLIKYIDV